MPFDIGNSSDSCSLRACPGTPRPGTPKREGAGRPERNGRNNRSGRSGQNGQSGQNDRNSGDNRSCRNNRSDDGDNNSDNNSSSGDNNDNGNKNPRNARRQPVCRRLFVNPKGKIVPLRMRSAASSARAGHAAPRQGAADAAETEALLHPDSGPLPESDPRTPQGVGRRPDAAARNRGAQPPRSTERHTDSNPSPP